MGNDANKLNKYVDPSVVEAKFVFEDGKTVLKDFFFTAPFKIVSPWKQPNGFLRAMVLSSSGGIMAGDYQDYKIDIGENACAEIISQSYEKIFKMYEGQFASRDCKINVGKNAILNYMPQPTIPFSGSAYKNNTEVHLADKTSKLIYHDVLIAGRVTRKEIFDYQYYNTLTKIYVGDELIYRDNSKYNPSKFDMTGFGMFEEYTHLSNLVIVNLGDGKEVTKKIRELLAESKEDITYGVSVLASDDVVVRILGREGNALELINQQIVDAVVPDDMA